MRTTSYVANPENNSYHDTFTQRNLARAMFSVRRKQNAGKRTPINAAELGRAKRDNTRGLHAFGQFTEKGEMACRRVAVNEGQQGGRIHIRLPSRRWIHCTWLPSTPSFVSRSRSQLLISVNAIDHNHIPRSSFHVYASAALLWLRPLLFQIGSKYSPAFNHSQ